MIVMRTLVMSRKTYFRNRMLGELMESMLKRNSKLVIHKSAVGKCKIRKKIVGIVMLVVVTKGNTLQPRVNMRIEILQGIRR